MSAIIGFDARMVHHSGIGTHIRGLTRAFSKLAAAEDPKLLYLGTPEILDQYEWMRGHSLAFQEGVYSFGEQFMFGQYPVDAYHFPHYNVPQRVGHPYVVTVHDLIHLLFPEHVGSQMKWRAGKLMLKRAVSRAAAVLTVSEWSKKDLVENLGVSPDRIHLTSNAVDPDFQAVPAEHVKRLRRRLGLEGEFLLAVGIDKPHKNFDFLIRAVTQWRKKSACDVGLAICGVSSADQERLGTAAGNEPWFRCLPYLAHDELPALYQAAKALVFPSLYEGFGLPVLEAQRVGCPVIASNASCVPEVGGDGAAYFDPVDQESLLAQLNRFVGNDAAMADLVARGRVNEQRYTWENSARILETVYQNLIQ